MWFTTKHIPKSYTCKQGKCTDICEESATQYRESEKWIISFLHKNWDRALQPLCDDMSAVLDPPVISVSVMKVSNHKPTEA
jgi:hypothetical protein